MSFEAPILSREWHLVRRPAGQASAEDFALVEAKIAEPQPGQIVVRNTHVSVDPYMRGRMDDAPSYMPPFLLNAGLDGGAVGIVTKSAAEGFEPGQVVEHFVGLREYSVVDSAAAAHIDVENLAPEIYLGALGMTGLTAWLGITQVADVQPGETVFVTGAAGAVGSMAGQIAKLRGAGRVIGSAGSAEKVGWLENELGFDVAFDYRDGDVGEQLARTAPDGIDVVFDNVGGRQLEAAIGRLTVGARLALSGMASQYDGRELYGVRNLYELISKRATARGLLVGDHLDQMPAFRAEVGPWLSDGRLKHRETIYDGIEQVPAALLGTLRSGTGITGKAIVRVEESA
jgi:hypothetical protein